MAADGWTALAESTGRLPGLALNLAQLQQQGQQIRALEADSQKRFTLLQDESKRKQEAFDYAKKKQDEQDKLDNAFVPASLRFPRIHEFPTLKKSGVDALRTAGFEVKETPDGEIYTTNKGYAYLNIQINNNPAFAKTVLENTIGDLQNKSANITKKILEIQESGKVDDKQLPVLQKQQSAIKAQIGELFSTQEEFVKEQVKRASTAVPHTTVETSPDGKQERTVIWDATTKQYVPMAGASGAWHPAKSQVINVNTGEKGDMAPIGNLRAIGLNLAAKYLPLAKGNMGKDAEKLSEGLFMTDQFGQNVNEARLRNYLTPEQQKAYDWIKIEAERLSKTQTPAKAVDTAIKTYQKKFLKGTPPLESEGTGKADTERQSAAAAIAAGKDSVAVKALYKKRTGKEY